MADEDIARWHPLSLAAAVRLIAACIRDLGWVAGRTAAGRIGTAASRLLRQQLESQLARLDVQEENLLDLAADAAIPKAKLKERLRRIAAQRARLQQSLSEADDDLSVGASASEKCLAILERPEELYRQMDDQGRQLLNQALFTKLYVFREEVTEDELAEPFAGLVELTRTVELTEKVPPDECTMVDPKNDKGR